VKLQPYLTGHTLGLLLLLEPIVNLNVTLSHSTDISFRFWLPMIQTVVGVFELPEDDTVEDEHFVEIDENQGFKHFLLYRAPICNLLFQFKVTKLLTVS